MTDAGAAISPQSLRAKRSNPEASRGAEDGLPRRLWLLAMTARFMRSSFPLNSDV